MEGEESGYGNGVLKAHLSNFFYLNVWIIRDFTTKKERADFKSVKIYISIYNIAALDKDWVKTVRFLNFDLVKLSMDLVICSFTPDKTKKSFSIVHRPHAW